MATDEKRSSRVPADPAESVASAGPPADGPVNPTALTVEQLARMLAVPAEKVRDHVAAGTPVAADGTVNLVHYAAWLNRELGRRDGD